MWAKFTHNLERLKRCHEELTEEQLATCYKKAYQRLRTDIVDELRQLIPQIAFSGVRFMQGDTNEIEKCVACVKNIIDQEEKAEALREICGIAFETCDPDKVMCSIIRIHDRVIAEAYSDYWLSKCKPCDVPGYSYYNEIIGMWYSDKNKSWVCKVDGKYQWATYYPPTKEGFAAEYGI